MSPIQKFGSMSAGTEPDIIFKKTNRSVLIKQGKDTIAVPFEVSTLFSAWVTEAAGNGQHPRKADEVEYGIQAQA